MTRARSGLGAVPVPASLMGLANVTVATGDTVVGVGGQLQLLHKSGVKGNLLTEDDTSGAVAWLPPQYARPQDSGFLAWTGDVEQATGNLSILAPGIVAVRRIRVRTTILVTNIHMIVSVAGNTLNNSYAAIYTIAATPTLVAATGENSAVWNSTGGKTMALSGGAVTLTPGDYWVGYWSNGTTSPRFYGANAAQLYTNGTRPAGNTARAGTSGTGVTTPPPTIGIPDNPTNGQWSAFS